MRVLCIERKVSKKKPGESGKAERREEGKDQWHCRKARCLLIALTKPFSATSNE
jgi:hypothetical protein